MYAELTKWATEEVSKQIYADTEVTKYHTQLFDVKLASFVLS